MQHQLLTMDVSKYLDTKMIVSIVVAIAAFVALFMLYNHFFRKKTENSQKYLTKEEYDKLSEEDKKLWKLDSDTNRYVQA